jgi:hypothetical protein
LFNAKNEAERQPAINIQIARAYLTATDPMLVTRTWSDVMATLIKQKKGSMCLCLTVGLHPIVGSLCIHHRVSSVKQQRNKNRKK